MNTLILRTHKYPLPLFLLLIFALLSACSEMTREEQNANQPASATTTPSNTKFEAWKDKYEFETSGPAKTSYPAAVISLAQQSDALIAKYDYAQASDKLERALRIAPDYAPGWSRLGWIALQNGDLAKARQLADRSNSYASGQVALKLLNWKIIRDASLQMKDDANVQRANRNIEALGNI
jgi:tetratricopeptide (TPR) repeat protein